MEKGPYIYYLRSRDHPLQYEIWQGLYNRYMPEALLESVLTYKYEIDLDSKDSILPDLKGLNRSEAEGMRDHSVTWSGGSNYLPCYMCKMWP